MKVLGIETSCDECAAAVVSDGKEVLSNIVATQIPFHQKWQGVVPEIASRKHTEWIEAVSSEALSAAGLRAAEVDAVAVTSSPGLLGSLLVGLTFAKTFAWALDKPFIACSHLLSHLYAARLSLPTLPCPAPPPYPHLGLLASGGHTVICRVNDFDDVEPLGATLDDAAGEAFDKVSRHFGWGYPGGKAIDHLSQGGDSLAFRFPLPKLDKHGTGEHRCDVSYSGLKTAVVNQLESFRVKKDTTERDLAASFQKTACEILLRALFNAVSDTGLNAVVTGGGAAANSYLRAALEARPDLRVYLPPPSLCGDNAAMVAGLGYQYISRGLTSSLTENASSRAASFRRRAR